jgi:hypothetical protein
MSDVVFTPTGDKTMATTILSASSKGSLERIRLSALQRYYLRRAHPASLFIDGAALTWIVYYFWNHLWVEALLVLVISRIIANIISFRANVDELAQTGLGKMALLHLQPVNLTVQLIGVVGLFYGLWTHEVKVILAGLSIIFLGHLIGWHRVDRRFDLG